MQFELQYYYGRLGLTLILTELKFSERHPYSPLERCFWIIQ